MLLAGCGACGPASSPPAADLDAPTLDATALDLVTQSGSFHRRQHAVKVAEETLVGTCMRAAGQDYPTRLPPLDHRTDEDRALRTEERRRTGYGLSLGADDGVPAMDRQVRGLSAERQQAFARALFGAEDNRRAIEVAGTGPVTFPGEGCLFEAQQEIYGDILTWARVTYVPEALNNRLGGSVTSAPAYLRTMRGWSACMARRGHRYASPAEAQADLTNRYRAGKSDRLLEQEIAVAVADADCAREGGVVRLVLDEKRRMANALPEAERRSLAELAEDWSRAVRTAGTIALVALPGQ